MQLDQHKYNDNQITKEFVSLDSSNQFDGVRRRDEDVLFQMKLGMSGKMIFTDKISHAFKEYDLEDVELPAKDIEQKINDLSQWISKDKENRYLIVISQLGSCFFILHSLWSILFFQNISSHIYILKLLKHIFYLKSDFKVFSRPKFNVQKFDAAVFQSDDTFYA